MNYTTIFSVIFVLGLLTLRMWLRGCLPTKTRVEAAQRLASQHIALGQWEAAYQKLNRLHELHLGGVKTNVLYAQVLRAIQKPQEALTVVQEALVGHPGQLDLIHQRGKALLELGRFEESLKDLSECRPIFQSEEDYLDYASSLFSSGYIQEAMTEIDPFVASSMNGRLHALAGDIYFSWKQHEKALVNYMRAEHCGWKSHPLLCRCAFCLYYCGRLEAAEQLFHKLLIHDSTDIASTLGLGAVLESSGRYNDALIVYQSGPCWNSCHPIILRQAGISALMVRQYRFAEMYLRAATQAGEATPKTLSYLAYSLECQRKWPEAEAVYKELVENNSDHIAGYRGVAYLYGIGLTRQTEPEVGLAMAREALKRAPDAVSWELLSACEARAGNFMTAHDIQEQLSSFSPDETTRRRRHSAMRTLRKGLPLDENLVCTSLVA